MFPHVSEVGREMRISGAMRWVPWIRGGIFDKAMSTFSGILPSFPINYYQKGKMNRIHAFVFSSGISTMIVLPFVELFGP